MSLPYGLQNEIQDVEFLLREGLRRQRELKGKIAANAKDEMQRRDDVAEAIREMVCGGGARSSVVMDTSASLSRALGEFTDANNVYFSLGDLGVQRRTLIAGTGSQGGYTVGLVPNIVPVSVDTSSVLRAGAQSFMVTGGTQGFAQWSTSAAPSWLTETGSASAVNPVFALASATPKRIAVYVEVSRQALRQSPVLAAGITEHFRQKIGEALDVAALSGTSGGNNPVGVPYWSGLGTSLTGTAFAFSNAHQLATAALNSGALESNLRAIGAVGVRSTLGQRSVGTSGSRYVWDDGQIAGIPAAASKNALASSLIVGDFTGMYVLLWDGVKVQVNPYSASYASDLVAIRATMYADVVPARPGGFAVATSVS